MNHNSVDNRAMLAMFMKQVEWTTNNNDDGDSSYEYFKYVALMQERNAET